MDQNSRRKPDAPLPADVRQFIFADVLSLSDIDDVMEYQPWTSDQIADGEVIREALTAAAKAILRHVPAGALRNVALRNIIEAKMNANAAISFRGRF